MLLEQDQAALEEEARPSPSPILHWEQALEPSQEGSITLASWLWLYVVPAAPPGQALLMLLPGGRSGGYQQR